VEPVPVSSKASIPNAHNGPFVWNRRGIHPTNAVYVGRGTPWGNPFVIGKDGDRDEVCDRFEREVLPALDVGPLVGKDLVCWCAPKRCHADALLRAAQGTLIRQDGDGTQIVAPLGSGPVGNADAPKGDQ
jgi:hypothetical protein